MPTSLDAQATADTTVAGLVAAWRSISTTAGRFPALAEKEFGLSANRLAALMGVANGAVRVQDVAALTWTSTSATSRTIDSLVRDGLLDRRPDPDDRRATALSLTPDGQAMADDIETWRHRIMHGVTDQLGSTRAREVVEALEDVEVALRDVLTRMADTD